MASRASVLLRHVVDITNKRDTLHTFIYSGTESHIVFAGLPISVGGVNFTFYEIGPMVMFLDTMGNHRQS